MCRCWKRFSFFMCPVGVYLCNRVLLCHTCAVLLSSCVALPLISFWDSVVFFSSLLLQCFFFLVDVLGDIEAGLKMEMSVARGLLLSFFLFFSSCLYMVGSLVCLFLFLWLYVYVFIPVFVSVCLFCLVRLSCVAWSVSVYLFPSLSLSRFVCLSVSLSLSLNLSLYLSNFPMYRSLLPSHVTFYWLSESVFHRFLK